MICPCLARARLDALGESVLVIVGRLVAIGMADEGKNQAHNFALRFGAKF